MKEFVKYSTRSWFTFAISIPLFEMKGRFRAVVYITDTLSNEHDLPDVLCVVCVHARVRLEQLQERQMAFSLFSITELHGRRKTVSEGRRRSHEGLLGDYGSRGVSVAFLKQSCELERSRAWAISRFSWL